MKKFRIPLFITTETLAVFTAVCFFPYFLHNIKGGKNRVELCFSIAIMIAVLVPAIALAVYFFLPSVRFFKKNPKLDKFVLPAAAVFCAALLIFALTFGALGIAIGTVPQNAPTVAANGGNSDGGVDVVLVFGCKTDGYTPSKTLRLRLDAALILLNDRPDSVCVVSGGQGADESVSEAASMARYLENAGVSSERIIVEDGSTNTSENFALSLAALKSIGIEKYNLYAVSNAYHLPRINIMAKKLGVKITPVKCADASGGDGFVGTAREYLAVWKFILLNK